MSQHALAVVRLLEQLQRMSFVETEETRADPDPMHQSPDDPRPPKRPWEDVSQEDGALPDATSFADVCLLQTFILVILLIYNYSSMHRRKINLRLRLSKIWSSSAQNARLVQRVLTALRDSRKANTEKEV